MLRAQLSRRHVRTLRLALASAALSASAFAFSNFTPGNFVIVRVGDGSAALTSAATPTFLDEYTSAGTLVQTIALPTAISGANFRVTNSGTATSEGALTVSSNGLYFVYGGYDAAVGTASVASTASASVSRVVARIDLAGAIDSTTALNDAFSGGNIRGVASDDGNNLWVSGPSASPRYATLGATVSTSISNINSRVITIVGGQLYVSSAAGSRFGVCTVGTGLPTTAGQTVTLLNGFPTATGPSSYDFFFSNASTLYVADDRTSANGGGIQKWTESAGTWTLQYTLAPTGTQGCRSLEGVVVGGVATLYATTTESNANRLVVVTDTGAGSSFTDITSAGTNTAFRGVRQVPQSAAPMVSYCTAGTSTNGCVPAISGSGTPSVAATSGFTISIANLEGQKQGLIFYGISGRNNSTWGIGGTSFLCVKPPTQRMAGQNSGGSVSACDGSLAQDWLAFIAAHPGALGTPFSAGNTVQAQGWYRDPPAVKTTNLSDGLEFTLAP